MEVNKATEPLNLKWKILSLIFPVFMIFILSGVFKADGYDRKATEFIKWNIYGLIVYSVFILILSAASNFN